MNSEALLISLAILGSSFWGSWHCAAMCGPIASLMARRNTLWSYHLGRGVSYIFIGMVGGYLGSFFLKNEFYYIRMVSGILFAGLLLIMGIQMLQGRNLLTSPKLNWLLSFYTKETSGFLLGFLTLFLPCGWLYSYVLAAVATQSAETGALTMMLFWAGGLPALSALAMFMKKSIQLAPQKKQMVAGLILIFAGVYSVASFYF